jgi:hypothetical protein
MSNRGLSNDRFILVSAFFSATIFTVFLFNNPSLLQLGDAHRFISYGLSSPVKFSNPFSSTEITQLWISVLSMVLEYWSVVWVSAFISVCVLFFFARQARFFYLFMAFPAAFWLFIPGKESLILVGSFVFVYAYDRSCKGLMLTFAFILCIFKAHIFLPLFLFLFLFRFFRRFGSIFLIVLTLFYILVLLLLFRFDKNLADFVTLISSHFRSDASLNMEYWDFNGDSYVKFFIKYWWVVFVNFPARLMESDPLLFVYVVYKNIVSIFVTATVLYFLLKDLSWVWRLLFIYMLVPVLALILPLSLFNMGAADRYFISLILGLFVLYLSLRITVRRILI